jgi:DNA-binding MarR family transcriptional regulator
MTGKTQGQKLEKRRREVVKSRQTDDRHHYFKCVADARFVLRRVFRIVEEQARAAGLDPLVHQVLVQIYGSENSSLRVKELAHRLDVAPAFASVLVKTLHDRGLISRNAVSADQRGTRLATTKAGSALLQEIDNQVKIHVDYFTTQLNLEQKERAVAILLFYVGLSVDDRA